MDPYAHEEHVGGRVSGGWLGGLGWVVMGEEWPFRRGVLSLTSPLTGQRPSPVQPDLYSGALSPKVRPPSPPWSPAQGVFSPDAARAPPGPRPPAEVGQRPDDQPALHGSNLLGLIYFVVLPCPSQAATADNFAEAAKLAGFSFHKHPARGLAWCLRISATDSQLVPTAATALSCRWQQQRPSFAEAGSAASKASHPEECNDLSF